MVYNKVMKTSTPNKPKVVLGLDVDTDTNHAVTTFRSTDLSLAMRICADWLDTTRDVYITAMVTYWDGDVHKWAIKVVHAYEPAPQPDDGVN
jgi:hypothetical protein